MKSVAAFSFSELPVLKAPKKLPPGIPNQLFISGKNATSISFPVLFETSKTVEACQLPDQ